jgi:hypothetical protein
MTLYIPELETSEKLPSIVFLFPSRLQIYIEKDLKYLLRNNRSLGAIIIEFLLFIFIIYMHITNVERYQDFYFPVFFITTFPTIVWDFFLNNYWGTEKAGFGLYLFSNVELNSLILSKNLSFLIIRIPLIFFLTIGMSIIFSVKYLPIIVLLYFSLTFISLSFSNIVSMNNPYPIELKENPFSHKQQQKFSIIGLLGLLLYIIVPTVILMIIYIIDIHLQSYLILIVMFLLILFLYNRTLKYSLSQLEKQKEIIFLKLVES